MKRLLFLLLASLLVSNAVKAQNVQHRENHYKAQRGTLQVSMSDRSLMVVSINGRKYNKVASSLTIHDLPFGRNTIEIYRFIPNRNSQGGTAQLIHRGSIRINPEFFYSAVYDVRSRRLYVDKNEVAYADPRYDDRDRVYNDNDNYYNDRNNTDREDRGYINNRIGMDQRRFESLKNRMNNSIGDSGKQKLFQSEMNAVRQISTTQLGEVLDLLSFDSSKLDFAKIAYPKLADKENAYQLEEKFSFESTREDFRALINGR